MEIVLTPEHQKLLQERLDSGRYSGPSEVVEEALELLRQREEASIEEERRLVQAGIDQIERGEHRTFNGKAELAAFAEEIRQRSAAKRGEQSRPG
jgi:antitoxin ParD1/3/4